MNRGDRFAVALLLVASVFFGLVLWAASPAKADATDTAFIEVLDDEGIDYPSERYAIRAGHVVCDGLDNGIGIYEMVTLLHKESALALGESGFFVCASVGAFCPHHAHLITGSTAA